MSAQTEREPMRRSQEWVKARIVVVASGCWEWTSSLSAAGYGVTTYKPKYGVTRKTPYQALAHRLSYEAFVGPIPAGLTIDHLCRNTRCANPDHLETVDIITNIMRGNGVGAVRARMVKCIRGHELSTATYPSVGKPRRYCRTCAKAREQAYQQKRGTR